MGKDFYKHKDLDQKGYWTEDWNKSPAEKSLGHIQGTESSFVVVFFSSPNSSSCFTWMRYQGDNTLYSKSTLGGPTSTCGGRSNSNSFTRENICRCSIKTWRLQSWHCLPALIVCWVTTVARGDAVHSCLQEPVAGQLREYFPNQTMSSQSNPLYLTLTRSKKKPSQICNLLFSEAQRERQIISSL